MKSNPYADLRIDNRADLPAPWYDYPVLQSGEYRTEILYTSGRVPVDMVRKAIRAGVPALVSKSMPTVQSLELAEEYGLKLFIRQKK